MANKHQGGLPLMNVLVFSVAMNVALIFKLMHSGTIQASHNRGQFLSHAAYVRNHSSPVARWPGSPEYAGHKANHEDLRQRVINLDHGDPVMYEEFWKRTGDETNLVITGSQAMSYFSDAASLCWFMEAELAAAIKRLHGAVGNAVVEDRQIVVGTGSSQLILAALYALSSPDLPHPVSVVSAVPYYSSYPSMTEFLKSGLYKWEGDARRFEKDGRCIELVTSPNNPDGFLREPVVNRSGAGCAPVHDLAYYWPQYVPISAAADYDLMLFTVSKATGHAGSRIGWAIVKDEAVARRMVKFVELNTIGVSKESQKRAAMILNAVVNGEINSGVGSNERFFDFGFYAMHERWQKLRAAVARAGRFSLPEVSPGFCNFSGRVFSVQPAFAWLECVGDDDDDCSGLLRRHKLLARSGRHFGASAKFVRVSLLDRAQNYDLFIQRLSVISLSSI